MYNILFEVMNTSTKILNIVYTLCINKTYSDDLRRNNNHNCQLKTDSGDMIVMTLILQTMANDHYDWKNINKNVKPCFNFDYLKLLFMKKFITIIQPCYLIILIQLFKLALNFKNKSLKIKPTLKIQCIWY